MAQDYNNPIDQMKAISWNLKRIADSLESIEDKMNSPKPMSMSETYQFKPEYKNTGSPSLRDFIGNLGYKP
jgi:hypothetical protein